MYIYTTDHEGNRYPSHEKLVIKEYSETGDMGVQIWEVTSLTTRETVTEIVLIETCNGWEELVILDGNYEANSEEADRIADLIDTTLQVCEMTWFPEGFYKKESLS